MKYVCKVASLQDIITKQNEKINKHPNDMKWAVWKNEWLERFNDKTIRVYYGLLDGKIITEATAVVSPYDKYIQNKEKLVDKNTVYLTAFGTAKEYAGQGYFSKLYKYMEEDLKRIGFEKLTLGVEPCEVRNILIYFNWGYTNYIKSAYESYPDGNKILVNFYGKNLK